LTDALAAPSKTAASWCSAVCFAFFVAFCLEPDNPFWAGTSVTELVPLGSFATWRAERAAIMRRPQLGASLRKEWSRMIGTVIGAAAGRSRIGPRRRAVGDHDRNTLRLRLDLRGDPTGFDPGMTVWRSRRRRIGPPVW
jgi:hypothetical protein